ncbi:MAG: dephospho-CoA kinase, partial [candidate division WOR-3 bacterium]
MRGAPGRSRRGRATLVVGVGGLPGAGKSEVAKYFSEQGAEVIDADRIGWELLEPGTVTYERVCKVFGSQVLDSSGRIDRRKLGEIVFRSKTARMRLNRIIHPRLLAELRRRAFARVRGRWPGSAVRVIDAALLFYWGWHRRVDLAIAVVAPRAIKLRRLMDQGLTRTQAGQRLGSQLPEAKLRAMADLVIVNNGSRGR